MRFLRVFLLLLIMALLPVRGSFAAVMSVGEEAVWCQAESSEATGPAHARHALEHDALHSAGERHHGQPASVDKCNLCSGLTAPACPLESLSSLGLGLPTTKVPPQSSVWPASFVSAGLERPPRSA